MLAKAEKSIPAQKFLPSPLRMTCMPRLRQCVRDKFIICKVSEYSKAKPYHSNIISLIQVIQRLRHTEIWSDFTAKIMVIECTDLSRFKSCPRKEEQTTGSSSHICKFSAFDFEPRASWRQATYCDTMLIFTVS
jgi:hypothetical protein